MIALELTCNLFLETLLTLLFCIKPPPKPQTESKPQASSGSKSKKQSLEDYEKEYLVRREQEQREAEEAAVEEVAEVASKKGALPKGF